AVAVAATRRPEEQRPVLRLRLSQRLIEVEHPRHVQVAQLGGGRLQRRRLFRQRLVNRVVGGGDGRDRQEQGQGPTHHACLRSGRIGSGRVGPQINSAVGA